MQIRIFPISYFLLMIGLLWACSPSPTTQIQSPEIDPFAHISDLQARKVLISSMEAMGGLAKWRSKKQLSFQKEYALLLENGEVEASANQQHRYSYEPNKIEIAWQTNDQQHLLVQENGEIVKTIDGQIDSLASQSKLTNTILSSTFVIDIPFKLLDPGAEIRYRGQESLENGQQVEVIQASYSPATHVNHSTPDIWKLYMDKNSHKLVGYMVQHADHFSYVRNLSDTIVDGFTCVTERESYRVDSLRNILYLRATYAYKNYQFRW
ncbi:MAG: hypothetical protein AAF587_27540 [Bacteroidota bacterium]